jgi:cytochrome c oxidase subunit I
MTVAEPASHGSTPPGGDTALGPGTPPRRSVLARPGPVRGVLCFAVFFLVGLYLVAGTRWLAGWHPTYDWEIIVLVGGLVLGPVGFLLGLGAFDYWLYWVSGRPTRTEDHASHGAASWRDYFRVNTDHKVIGVQYLVTTFVFFFVGGLMAMLFRAELARPGMQFMDTQTYNGLVSVHAALMIFVFVIPAFAGIANYVVPLMLGAPDMAFPRLNALSFWLLPIAGAMFTCSLLVPGGPFATGWTSYAPLASEQPYGQVFFNMGVQWAGASSIMTALNFLVTIITMRAPGMTFWRMPLLVWANFTTSVLVVVATPFIAGSQFLVLFDRVLHTSFFVPEGGGYVLGYQHIFWFYSHPAVYIMILPGFGIISEIISVMSRKPIFGYRLMAMSLIGILVLSFSVWAHHMFVAGISEWIRVPMMLSSLLIAVPTGIKIFSWLATLWQGRLRLNTPMLWALGFISVFVIGGLSGVYVASVPIDLHVSDTYFIVAHIHYVLFGGSVFSIFAGIYYWFPKMTGRMYDEGLGKLHFWLTFVSFNATFFPMHWLGLQGMPRRVADYADRFGDVNMFVSIASFVLGASMLVFVWNMVVSWARGPIAESNPWRALTLEWQVSSPPPLFNFDDVPQVVGGPYEYGVPGARHAQLAPAVPAPRRVAT